MAKSATKWHACPTAEDGYIYDGKGERVEKCAVASATTACPTSGTTGTLYWKGTGSETLAETDLGGNDEEEYLFFGGARIARRDTTSTGTTVAVHYYFSDHLGSHGVIYSQTGTTCEQDIDYYPYGGVENDYCAGSGVTQNYKFTGKERDAESGLDNFGARYDSSALGRFMTPDWAAKPTTVPYAKFGDPQSLNLYSYVENGPLNRIDPDGHNLIGLGALFAAQQRQREQQSQTASGGNAPSDQIKNAAQNTINTNPPTPKPPPMAELKTDMSGHTTTLLTTDKNDKLTVTQIETHNDVAKSAKPGADAPYKSDVAGVSNRHWESAAYGPKGAFIDTGDSRGRDIHGGGTGLADPLAPQQGWKPTLGCTRGQNEDVINLGNAITQFQQANPGVVIPYVRE